MTTLTETAPSQFPSADSARASSGTVAAPKKRAPAVLAVLGAVALVAMSASYFAGKGKETTDDAQIEGRVSSVAPRIPGQVKRVLVQDNQDVKVGDVLVELDARDQEVRLLAAKADHAASLAQLRAAETQLAVTERSASSNLIVAKGGVTQASAVSGTTRATIDQARADIFAAESRRLLASTEFERTKTLFDRGAVAQAELDTRKATIDQADAALLQAKARLVSAEANLANSAGTIEAARGRLVAAEAGPEQIEAARAQVSLANARVDQAKAVVDQAELNLSYTQIKAETAGTVARRTVEQGQLVSPDRPLLAIVPLEDTWVVANFKEDQVAEMRPGQPAHVTIDSFGGRKFEAHVDSLAAGTGSRFSLLPPDNASGNFTKVVQRVPVLLRFEPHSGVVLRPGMSATATVVTK